MFPKHFTVKTRVSIKTTPLTGFLLRHLACPSCQRGISSISKNNVRNSNDLPPASPRRTFATLDLDEEDLEHLTIQEILQAFSKRTLTPTNLARATLARIRNMNQLMKAFTFVVPEMDAVIQTRDSDLRWRDGGALGSLDGVPISVKDVFMTKNIPTSCGTGMLLGFQGGYDATVVELLASQGSLIVGKTMMDEFGMGSNGTHTVFGPTINPFNCHPPSSMTEASSTVAKRVAGGSSGGSAASVAAGMCFAALGSDTGGSVRMPASYCGVVGLKPSFGRLSRWGMVTYASSLDTVGILTRAVDDLKVVYDVLNKYDSKDPCSSWTLHHAHQPRQFTQTDPSNLKGIRVGIPKEYYVKELSLPTLSAWNRAILYLESCGAECVPVSLPHTQHALAAYYIIQPAEATKSWKSFTEMKNDPKVGSILAQGKAVTTDEGVTLVPTKTDGFGDEVMRRILMGTFVLSEDDTPESLYQEATRYRRLIQRDFDKVFSSANPLYPGQPGNKYGVDVLLTPTTVATAPLLDDVLRKKTCVEEYVNDVMTVPASLAGVPAMCVPFGMSTEDGFPLGLQLIAQYGDETALFLVGKALESAQH